MQKIYTLYVLECSDKNYYVGVTTNMKRRFQQHKLGLGASFTKLHKPIKIFDEVCIGEMDIEEAEKYENARTLELISAIGLKNVRGGKYFSGNIKSKSLRRAYKSLDSKYKNFSSAVPRLSKRAKTKKQNLKNPWLRQEIRARREINVSNAHLI